MTNSKRGPKRQPRTKEFWLENSQSLTKHLNSRTKVNREVIRLCDELNEAQDKNDNEAVNYIVNQLNEIKDLIHVDEWSKFIKRVRQKERDKERKRPKISALDEQALVALAHQYYGSDTSIGALLRKIPETFQKLGVNSSADIDDMLDQLSNFTDYFHKAHAEKAVILSSVEKTEPTIFKHLEFIVESMKEAGIRNSVDLKNLAKIRKAAGKNAGITVKQKGDYEAEISSLKERIKQLETY